VGREEGIREGEWLRKGERKLWKKKITFSVSKDTNSYNC